MEQNPETHVGNLNYTHHDGHCLTKMPLEEEKQGTRLFWNNVPDIIYDMFLSPRFYLQKDLNYSKKPSAGVDKKLEVKVKRQDECAKAVFR